MPEILLVHEYPGSVDEWICPQLRTALNEKTGEKALYFHGLFRRYQPGSLRPSRIINLAYMSLALPLVLLFRRPVVSIIRSAPVGLHLWAAVWLRLLRLRGVCWLMDYHPEMEVRALSCRTWGKPIATLLRAWDKFTLRTYKQIIVLDPAMDAAVKERLPDANVIIFPTWAKETPKSVPHDWLAPPHRNEPLTLLYGGHLGAGHDLGGFSLLLSELAVSGPVQLLVVGANEEGVERFQHFCAGMENVTMEVIPRVPFEELPKLAREHQVHYGLIFMKEELKGLLSPSKFSGYLAAGIPTLYFGPRDTNADRVCREFGGGVAVGGTTDGTDFTDISEKLRMPQIYANYLEGTKRAGDFFFAFTAEKLAELIDVE